jgi:vacuolar-type H+-ATPase subunit E/Vma4
MSEEKDPTIDELKAEAKEQVERIVIEEEDLDSKDEKPAHDVAAEFQKMGQQLGETLQSAWESEERKRIEKEVREGVQSFVAEVDKVLRDVRSSESTSKLKEDAADAKAKVEDSELGQKAREGIVEGLRWLSEGLNELAIKFTPPEKPADDASAEE